MPGWYWIIGFSAVLIGVIEYAFSMLKIVAIVVFILLGAVFVMARRCRPSGVGLNNFTAHGGFFPHGVKGMWFAVIVSIFSYLNIETITVAAGEARDSQRAVARAFCSNVFRVLF